MLVESAETAEVGLMDVCREAPALKAVCHRPGYGEQIGGDRFATIHRGVDVVKSADI